MPKYSVFWLSQARQEKDALIDYIAERNVLAALGADEHIKEQVGQLQDFPFLGRKGRIDGTFELVITQTPFIVVYRLYKDEIQVLHVYHERQDWMH